MVWLVITMVVLVGILLIVSLFCGMRFWNSRKWGQYQLEKDLSGQVVVITGGTSGLGFETSKVLASRNAHIIWGCRDKELASRKKEEIR